MNSFILLVMSIPIITLLCVKENSGLCLSATIDTKAWDPFIERELQQHQIINNMHQSHQEQDIKNVSITNNITVMMPSSQDGHHSIHMQEPPHRDYPYNSANYIGNGASYPSYRPITPLYPYHQYNGRNYYYPRRNHIYHV